MKVFLSHSTKDKEFVQRLADALIGADFEPWLCEVDIEKNRLPSVSKDDTARQLGKFPPLGHARQARSLGDKDTQAFATNGTDQP